MSQKKIGWQKYEDLLEKQINSPIIEMISNSVKNVAMIENAAPLDPLYKEFEDEIDIEQMLTAEQPFLSIPEDISNEIQLTANFDCWLGHTNFNISKDIKNKLNAINGVEVLKICSRYRFFIGVGRMFDFSNVRTEIEETIL